MVLLPRFAAAAAAAAVTVVVAAAAVADAFAGVPLPVLALVSDACLVSVVALLSVGAAVVLSLEYQAVLLLLLRMVVSALDFVPH